MGKTKLFLDSDMIIEAIPKSVELKKKAFKEVDELAPKHTIITSNTSSISTTDLSSATITPEKFCGQHWFNPPQLMELIKLIDYTGLGLALHTLETLQREFRDPKYRSYPLLRQMVRAELLGRKVGKCFYEWK